MILDLANAFLELAKTPIGQFVTQLGLLGGTLGSVGSLATHFIPQIISGIGKFTSGIGNLAKGFVGIAPAASQATGALGKIGSFLLKMPGWAKIAGAALLGIGVIWAATPKQVEPTVEELETEINDLTTQLEENQSKLKELNAIPWYNRTDAINQERNALIAQNAELERNIELKKQEKQEAWLAEMSGSESPYRRVTTQSFNVVSRGIDKGYGGFSWGAEGVLDQITVAVGDIEEAYEQAAEIVGKFYGMNEEEIEAWIEEYGSAKEAVESFGVFLLDQVDNLDTLENSLMRSRAEVSTFNLHLEQGKELTGAQKNQYVESAQALMQWANEVDGMGIAYGDLNAQQQAAYDAGKQLLKQNEDGITVYAQMLDQMYAVESQTFKLADGTEYTTQALSGLEASMIQAASGSALVDGQYQLLIQRYPQLNELMTQNNGLWYLNKDALISAAQAGNNWAIDMINASNEATKKVIKDTEARITSLKAEAALLQGEMAAATTQLDKWEIYNQLTGVNNAITMATADLEKAKAALIDIPDPVSISGGDKDYGGTSSRVKNAQKEVDLIEEQNDRYEEQNDLLERQIELKRAQGASDEEILALMSQYQNQLHEQAEWLRSQGLDPYDERITEKSLKWLDLQEEKADVINDTYGKQTDELENQINLLERNGATAEELVAKNKELQNLYHQQAEELRAMGYSDDSEEISALSDAWWDIEDENTEILRNAYDERLQISENYIEDRNFYNDWGADNEIAAWDRVQKWTNEMFKQGFIDAEYYYEQCRYIAKKRYSAEGKYIDQLKDKMEELKEAQEEERERIKEAWETAFDYVADKAQDEIDALEKQKEAIEEYWQTKIDALQESNDELEDQIALEEKLDALARAKQQKVLVYKDGRYQYLQDVDAVSEAQADLDKLEREQQLQQELDNLETLRDQEIASIDKQIEWWEKYKEEWESIVDDYEKEQDRLIAEQVLGTELEGDNWEKRLGQVESFKNQYVSFLQEIADAQANSNNNMQNILDQLQNSDFSGQFDDLIAGTGGGGSGNHPYNWKEGVGVTNWVGGTQTNEKGWVLDGKVGVHKSGIGGGVSSVWYDPSTGKVMTSGLGAGDIIYTQGGAYMITGGTAGNYTSVPYNPDVGGTVSGGSSGGGGGGGGSSSSFDKVKDDVDSIKDSASKGDIGGVLGGVASSIGSAIGAAGSAIGSVIGGLFGGKHASGTTFAPGGLSLVGENGPELRVLGKGDGILPNKIAENLWKWGELNPNQMIASMPAINSSKDQITNISIQNFSPNLPGVKNGEDFVKYMKQSFFTQTVQYVNRSS